MEKQTITTIHYEITESELKQMLDHIGIKILKNDKYNLKVKTNNNYQIEYITVTIERTEK